MSAQLAGLQAVILALIPRQQSASAAHVYRCVGCSLPIVSHLVQPSGSNNSLSKVASLRVKNSRNLLLHRYPKYKPKVTHISAPTKATIRGLTKTLLISSAVLNIIDSDQCTHFTLQNTQHWALKAFNRTFTSLTSLQAS